MGDGAPDERRTRVFRRLKQPFLDPRCQETASLPIPDELTAEILLRLPAADDLARASAVCATFRRVATGRPFLRQYRRIHPPPLLGFLDLQDERKIFHPAVPPSPSATEAGAVSSAADFSFSFLPAPASDWLVWDVRDGRVLLDRRPKHDVSNRYKSVFPEMVVCDPLHRRYVLLPPIPDHLTSTVERPLWSKQQRYCETFLAPCGGDGKEEEASAAEETSFKVVWMAQCMTGLVAFVFSSNTGQWRAVPSRRWSDLSAGLPPSTAESLFYSRHYVYGCFYWMTFNLEESHLLVLDIKTMEFSIANPPPLPEANSGFDFTMVEAGEGRPGMFVLPDIGSDLSYFIRQNHGGSSSQWQKVKTISVGYFNRLICNTEKHLLLYKLRRSEAGVFKLDMETFQLEKVCTLGSSIHMLHAYRNFPPSLLSPPTISSGVEKRAEKEMLDQGCTGS